MAEVENKTPFPKMPTSEAVDDLWKGSVDMHIHVPPEIGVIRRFDAYQTAEVAYRAGMRGVVLKNHNAPTQVAAYAIQRLLPDIAVIGSMFIEYGTTAGLNEHTAEIVENQAKMGTKVLWFPTFDAAWHRNFVPNLKGTGIHILKEDGALDAYAAEVLKVVKQYDMVLCSGHISYPECEVLFKEAKKAGIAKLVATHPMSAVSRTPYTLEEMKSLVSLGGVVEHCWRNCLPQLKSYDPHLYVDAVKEVGAENCILATDFAQVSDPSPAEGLRTFIAVMLQFGLSEKEVEYMVKTNPYKLLDLK